MKPFTYTKTTRGTKADRNNDVILMDDKLGLYVIADGINRDIDGGLASTEVLESLKNLLLKQKETVDRLFDEKDYQQLSLMVKNQMYQTSVRLYTKGMEERKDLRVQFVAILLREFTGLIFYCGRGGIGLIREGKFYPLITEEYRDSEGLIGSASSPQVGSVKIDLFPDDIVLIYSDGASSYIESSTEAIVSSKDPRRLLERVFESPSEDNATCILLQFPSAEGRAGQEAIRRSRGYHVVQSIPIFRALTMAELNQMMTIVTEAKFKDGEVIVKEGDRSNGLFVITDGSCDVLVSNKRVATIQAGTYIGEVSWIDGAPRSATVRARGPVEVLFFERKSLLRLMSKNPGLAVKILGTIAQILAKRLRITNEKLNRLLDKYKEVKSALREYEALEVVEVVTPEGDN